MEPELCQVIESALIQHWHPPPTLSLLRKPKMGRWDNTVLLWGSQPLNNRKTPPTLHVCVRTHTHTHTHTHISVSTTTCVAIFILVTQSCLTLWNPKDCSPPDSFVHGFLPARVLEWVAIPFSRGSFQPRDRTQFCISGQILYHLTPNPGFLPGESQGQRSLIGCRLWGRTESDMAKVTQQQQQHDRSPYSCISTSVLC